MWVLWLMVLLNGDPVYSQLHRYPTEAACLDAQVYVLEEMRKAYPEDVNLRVYCSPSHLMFMRHKDRQRKGRWSHTPFTKEL